MSENVERVRASEVREGDEVWIEQTFDRVASFEISDSDFVIADSEAQERGAVRLREARGSIRAAFESLGLGWTYDDVERYLLAAPSYQAMLLKLGGDQHGLLQGLIMGFAVVAVEQERIEEMYAQFREHNGSLGAAAAAIQRERDEAEGSLREALDLLERLRDLHFPEGATVTDHTLFGFLRRHNRLTEGDSQ